MKKILTIICALFVICSNGQKVTIKYNGYTSYFDLQNNIPDSVTWTITKEHLLSSKTPRGNKFHSTDGRKDLNKDYAHSGYDKGHQSPYDDNYYSPDAEYQCFDFVNMVGQRHILNAQTWEHLEVFSRHLALQYDSVKVKTSWVGIDTTIGVDKVVVPQYCIKELWYGGKYEKYIIPNNDTCVKHPFTYYKVN